MRSLINLREFINRRIAILFLIRFVIIPNPSKDTNSIKANGILFIRFLKNNKSKVVLINEHVNTKNCQSGKIALHKMLSAVYAGSQYFADPIL